MKTEEQRFWSRVDKNGPILRLELGACWVWTGGVTGAGYGGFYVRDRERPQGRRQVPVHRWSYEQAGGPIADGLQVDHLCFNKVCVNPGHLEAVTPKVNGARSSNWAGTNIRKTHCPKGHPYEGQNLIINHAGSRECRTCKRDKDKRRARPNTDHRRALSRERTRRYRERQRENKRAGLGDTEMGNS